MTGFGFSNFDKQENSVQFKLFMEQEYNGTDFDPFSTVAINHKKVQKKNSQKSNQQIVKSDFNESVTSIVKDKKKKPNAKSKSNFTFIIRANDSWKFQWDILILLIAIFNSVTIPLTLAFDEIEDFLSANLFYHLFNNYFAVFIFLMDIVLQMNTTYYDSDG